MIFIDSLQGYDHVYLDVSDQLTNQSIYKQLISTNYRFIIYLFIYSSFSLIPDKLDNSTDDNSDELGPDSRVCLPIKISSFAYNLSTNAQQINTNVDSIQLPSLSVQINGWKPIYPISLDRLGTYYRVIERLNNAEPVSFYFILMYILVNFVFI